MMNIQHNYIDNELPRQAPPRQETCPPRPSSNSNRLATKTVPILNNKESDRDRMTRRNINSKARAESKSVSRTQTMKRSLSRERRSKSPPAYAESIPPKRVNKSCKLHPCQHTFIIAIARSL